MPDNQTNEQWLELREVADDPTHRGTGLALREARGPKEYFKDRTYDEMLQEDAQARFFAFAWVPHAVMSYSDLQKVECSGRCVKTCKRPGCICDRSIGRCK